MDIINGTCNSCNVDNCIECQNYRNCSKCIDGYEVLNGECVLTCEKGSNEKCLENNNTDTKFLKIVQDVTKAIIYLMIQAIKLNVYHVK